MKTKNETELLQELILGTQKKRDNELQLLKYNFHGICESLKPLNLIKHVFDEVANSEEIKNNFTHNIVGLGTGYLIKKALVGNSDSFMKRILGWAIQLGTTKLVSANFNDIKLVSEHFFKQIFNSKKPQ